jgi:DNA-binding transcriptional LysR family regulator
MTLEQLRIFVAVAEREHVTRAAEAVRLTQSAVSSAIASLENQYGVALFHRIGRRIELTQDGKMFLEEARAVLARAAAAERSLQEINGLERGVLAVQASQTIASYWLPQRLVAFRKAHPKIDIELTIGNTQQVARAIGDGTAEIGFVEGRVDDPALEIALVAHDKLVIVVAPGHPWARKAQLKRSDLLQGEWVLREKGSGTRSEFEAALRDQDVDIEKLKVGLELPSNEAVRAAVESGAGATAISEFVVASGLQSGALVRMRYRLPERPFHVLKHRDRHCSRAGQALLAMLA